MKRIAQFLFAGAAVLAVTSCLKVKQLVVVNPDGSGNIVVSTAFPPESVAMMSQMGALQGLDAAGSTAAPAVDLFYDEDSLRLAAKEFGEGVSLQKSERIDKDGTKGAIAVYAFEDIRKVKLNTRQNMQAGDALSALRGGGVPAGGDFIRFAFTTGETRRLTILMPQFKAAPAAKPASVRKSDEDLPPELAALASLGGGGGGGLGGAMAMQMFKGMEMSFALQVKGEVVKANASHPDAARKDRFVLLGMKLDELMTSPEFQKMANTQVTDQGEMMKLLYTLPGAQLETNTEVVIEFKPQR